MTLVVRTEKGTYAGPYPFASEQEAKDAARLMNQRAEKQGLEVRYEVKEEE